mmetsp:Transcript_23673/g.54589  ORF Transcript_23673/g.54589 Transcript_23673/m.54589 type:complete len:171 (+) Transcript_23673:71-583(+)
MRVLGAVVALAAVAGARARSSKDWSQLNFDALEHEWEDGDDEAELITEDELLYRETERRREVGIEVSDEMDAATVRHQQSMAGPAMMFVELRPTKPDGSAFVEEDYKWLAGSWREVRSGVGLIRRAGTSRWWDHCTGLSCHPTTRTASSCSQADSRCKCIMWKRASSSSA